MNELNERCRKLENDLEDLKNLIEGTLKVMKPLDW